MVKYYCELSLKRSEMFTPLTEFTKGGPTENCPIKWTPDFTNAFQKIKSLITKDTIIAYMEVWKKYMIHPEPLDVRLGA